MPRCPGATSRARNCRSAVPVALVLTIGAAALALGARAGAPPSSKRAASAGALATRRQAADPAAGAAALAAALAEPVKPVEMEVMDVICRIVEVLPGEGMTRRVIVDRGREDGLVVGWGGKLRSTHANKNGVSREARVIGRAVVVSTEPDRATVEVTVTDTAPDGMVRVGDNIELRTRVPRRAVRSYLWKLMRLGIVLTDQSRRPYITYRDLYNDDTPERSARVYAEMLREIHEIGTEYGDAVIGTKPLEGGRDQGKTGRQAMETADEEDLVSFFRFVENFPGKYIGKDWKTAEVYATWVINNTPLGEEEIAEIVLAAKTPAERTALLKKHADNIKKEGVLEYWVVRAQKLAKEREFAKAHALRQVVAESATLTDDPSAARWAHFTDGFILDEEQKSVESDAAYTRSYEAFRDAKPQSADDSKGVAYSLNNRAGVRKRIGRFEEALADYREAQQWRLKSGETSSNSLVGVAQTLDSLGRYAESLEAYEQARLVCLKYADTNELLKIELKIAGVAARLGKNAEATAAYKRIADVRAKEGDGPEEAEARIQLGDHLWKLGENREALTAYERVLVLRRAARDARGTIPALTGVGRLKWNLGDYDGSKKAHAEALALARALGDRSAEANALREIADVDRQSGALAPALAGYQASADRYRELGQKPGEATALEGVGAVNADRRDWPAAFAAYDRAVTLREATGAKSEWAGALAARGWVSEARYDLEAALRDYEQALKLRRETGAKADEAESLLSIATLRWRRLEYDAAQKGMDEALAVAKAVGSRLLIADCHRRRGDLARARYRNDEAQAELEAALALYRDPAGGDRVREADTMTSLAQLFDARGEYRAALPHYESALKLAREVKARTVVARILTSLISSHRRLGDVDKALALQKESFDLARELGDDFLLVDAHHDRAVLLADSGDQREAGEELAKAMEIAQRLSNKPIVAFLHNTIGIHLYQQGDYDAAEAELNKALEVGATTCGPDFQVTVLGNRSEIYAVRGDYEAAVHSLDSAVAVGRGVGDPSSMVHLLWTRGKLLRERGESRLAAGDAATATADFAEALKALDEALVTARRIEWDGLIVHALLERGAVLLAQKRGADAEVALEEARRRAEAARAPNILWDIHYHRSRALEARGDLAGAEVACRLSVETVEGLRKNLSGGDKAQETFLRSRIKVYERMAEILGRLNANEKDPEARRRRAEEALKFVSLARFQVTENIARSVRRTGDPELDQAARRYTETVTNKGKLEAERSEAVASGNQEKAQALAKLLADTEEKLVAQYVKLNDTDPDFASRLKFDPRRLLDSAGSLPEDALLLVLFPGEESLHLWIFNSDGFVAWKRVPVTRENLYSEIAKFQAGVDEVRRRVQSREPVGKGWGEAAENDAANPEWYRANIAAMRAATGRLSDWIVGPIAGEVAKAKTLLVLPYGKLCYLPFEALDATETADGAKFLGENRQVAYFTNEAHLQKTLLQLNSAPKAKEDVWVAFADPIGDIGTMLDAARQISVFFPNQEIHSQTTKTASEEFVYGLRPDATILHFGTHGYLNSSNPNKTFLQLQPPPEGVRMVDVQVGGQTTQVEVDGSLSQLEVYPFLRKAVAGFKSRQLRLVTLAACDTARAQDNPESEVLGLPDAFTMAGAPAVIASLWPVEVFATSDLMVDFYRRLAVEKKGKAEALQEARRTLVKSGEYSHPYYWTPFILFGNWR